MRLEKDHRLGNTESHDFREIVKKPHCAQSGISAARESTVVVGMTCLAPNGLCHTRKLLSGFRNISLVSVIFVFSQAVVLCLG